MQLGQQLYMKKYTSGIVCTLVFHLHACLFWLSFAVWNYRAQTLDLLYNSLALYHLR